MTKKTALCSGVDASVTKNKTSADFYIFPESLRADMKWGGRSFHLMDVSFKKSKQIIQI